MSLVMSCSQTTTKLKSFHRVDRTLCTFDDNTSVVSLSEMLCMLDNVLL